MNTRLADKLSMGLLFAAIVCAGLTGCGARDRGNVAGKVTFQGQPVGEGQVVFYYYDGEYGVFVPASLNADGTFEVKTPDGPGLPVGEYDVAVTPPRQELPKGQTRVTVKAYPNIPERYRSPKTSKLLAKVDKNNPPFEFDLKP